MALLLSSYILLSSMAVLIVGINIAVCTTIAVKKKLRTYTNGFIFSMSLSDLLFGAVFLPVYLKYPLHNMNGYVTAVCLFSNVGNLCSLTTERALALLRPLHYRDIIGRYFISMIVLAWIIPIAVSVLPLAWQDTTNTSVQNIYLGCLIAFFIILPYVYIILAYSLIFHAVRTRQGTLRYATSKGYFKSKAVSRSELRVARLFFIVSLFFAIVWVPSVYMTICIMVERFDLIPAELEVSGVYLFGFNSILNSLLYTFMKPDLRSVFRRSICNCLSSRLKSGSTMREYVTEFSRNPVYTSSQRQRELAHRQTTPCKIPKSPKYEGERMSPMESKFTIPSLKDEEQKSTRHRLNTLSKPDEEDGETVMINRCSKDEFEKLKETDL